MSDPTYSDFSYLHSPGSCLCKIVRRAARGLTNHYDQALSSIGLKVTQYSILSSIDHAQQVSLGELAEMMSLDQTTTTRNIKLLEQAGLVERVAHADSRVKPLRLTGAGRKKLSDARGIWQGVQSDLISRVGAERLHDMLETAALLETAIGEA